ncbi:hypothetical protein ACFFRR_007617 [Megaselia abdita]
MKRIVIIAIFTIALSHNRVVETKIFSRCQLAKELLKQQFSRQYLPNWVCLVEHESGRSTSKINQASTSVSYGLFQINSKQWCRKGRKGGQCDMKCEDFTNNDITDDSKCAMRIFNTTGFRAWQGWVSKCKGRNLPDISRC